MWIHSNGFWFFKIRKKETTRISQKSCPYFTRHVSASRVKTPHKARGHSPDNILCKTQRGGEGQWHAQVMVNYSSHRANKNQTPHCTSLAFSRRLFWLGQSSGHPECHAIKSCIRQNWKVCRRVIKCTDTGHRFPLIHSQRLHWSLPYTGTNFTRVT
jgi:hypothetical protein